MLYTPQLLILQPLWDGGFFPPFYRWGKLRFRQVKPTYLKLQDHRGRVSNPDHISLESTSFPCHNQTLFPNPVALNFIYAEGPSIDKCKSKSLKCCVCVCTHECMKCHVNHNEECHFWCDQSENILNVPPINVVRPWNGGNILTSLVQV